MAPLVEDTRGRRAHALLIEHWDPIGVRDIAEAQDEYSGYSGEIATRLHHGAGSLEIAGYLSWAQDHMGLPKTANELEGVARTVTNWYAAEMNREESDSRGVR